MKRRTLAAIIASVFALAAYGWQAAEKPTEGSAISAEAVISTTDTQDSAETPSGELPVIDAMMTHTPEAPPPVNRDCPAKATVKMEIIRKIMTMADGVEYKYWTFGDDVPGQIIHVCEGDTAEAYLSNHPTLTTLHNVDFHAVMGTGGDMGVSFTAPGHTSTFSSKTLQPGLYTCRYVVALVGMHITSGIHGLILIEPKGSLPKMDKEFYVVQDDFYTKGKYNDKGLQDFDMDKAIKEQPEYVVFNGHAGSIVGDNALKAKTGEKVRIFVDNGGSNLVSSFHVIDEIFDTVHVEGGDLINRNVQTTIVLAGDVAIIDFRVDIPGSCTLADHSIFYVSNKGALGQLKVEGEEDLVIMTKKLSDIAYQLTDGVVAASAFVSASAPAASAAPAAPSEVGSAPK